MRYLIVSISTFLLFSSLYANDIECSSALKTFINVAESKGKVIKMAQDLELLPEEIEYLKTGLRKFAENGREYPDTKKIESYLLFTQSLRSKKKMKALLDIYQLDDYSSKSPYIHKFYSIRKKVEKFQRKEIKKAFKKIDFTASPMEQEKAKKIATKKVKELRSKYEKITYGCLSSKFSKEHQRAAIKYMEFTQGIGIVSKFSSYSYHHWDEEKNINWFSLLGYEIGSGMAYRWISGKIVSNPSTNPLMKSIQSYFGISLTGLVDLSIYSTLFGISKKEAEKKLQEIILDSNYQEQITSLANSYESKRIFQQAKDKFYQLAYDLLPDRPHKTPVEFQDIDWDNISRQDLENEKVRDHLLSAIMLQLYEENTGEWIKLGDKGVDRFAYYSIYTAATMPHTMFLDLLIYRTLCMGIMNPTKALLQSLGMYTLRRIFNDQLQYYLRNKAINQ